MTCLERTSCSYPFCPPKLPHQPRLRKWEGVGEEGEGEGEGEEDKSEGDGKGEGEGTHGV